MKRVLVILGVNLFTLVGSIACSQQSAAGANGDSHGGPIRDHVSFVDHLRSRGLTVEPVDTVQQPFLQAETGTLLRISGQGLEQPAEVQSFDYTNASTAAADVKNIGPDGNPKNAKINWNAPPHWFHKERLIALYVGQNQVVLDLLTELLGPQFAGE